jgi:hypothetical protein
MIKIGGTPPKNWKVMVGYWANLTFLFGKENVKNGLYGVFFLRKKWL